MSRTSGHYTAQDLRQRLSISTLVFRGFRALGEGALLALAQAGIRRVELLESPEQYDMADPRSMALVGQACRNAGVQVVAYHCYRTHFDDVASDADRDERIARCKRQVDTMVDLGGDVWACHAGIPDASVRRAYEQLSRHVEGTRTVVAIENFPRDGVGVEERIAFLEEVDHANVGLLLDIGHVRDAHGANPMTQPGGPGRILGRCGARLRHLHLHGFRDGRDHHPPLVEADQIQWAELLRALREQGYGGHLNFEPAGEPRCAETLALTARAPDRLARLVAAA